MPIRAATLLREYRARRDFAKTAEPAGKKTRRRSKAEGLRFVVHKHDASHLHYDFRLELDGVLKSWAVAKGPSLNPKDRRLAIRVEDHPLEYASFEGTIPEGEYGAGTVMLWDEGTWEPLEDPHQGLDEGSLKFRLHGRRLKGSWALVHMRGRDAGGRENWLLIKHDDDDARRSDGITGKFTTSVETGRHLEDIARGRKSRRRPPPAAKVRTGGRAPALPDFRPPQLATLVDEVPQGSGWLFEMKYDGYRCLAAVAGAQVRLYTRNGNDWTTRFDRLVEPFSRLTPGSALIDGELCSFKGDRTDFSTLKDALSTSGDLVYFAFDLLEQDGESLERLPLIERKERLGKLLGKIEKTSPIQFSDHIRGQGEKVHRTMCENGFEGVIAKRADAPYRHERTRTWLKIKCVQRQEFVIGGWRPSDKHKGFASLLLGTWEDGRLVYRGRVGTGFDHKSAAALQAELDQRTRKTSPFVNAPREISRHARWVEPELVGEVAFTELTPDGYLRHPSFIGLREDKPARSIGLEKPAGNPAGWKSKARRGRTGKLDEMHLTDEMGIAAADEAGVRLTSPDRVVFPGQGVTKAQLVAYYAAVADRMLPYLADRPLSLVRCPQGRARSCFFQKHDSGGFPEAVKKLAVTEKDGDVQDYFYIDDLAGLIAATQMNTLEYHVWGSRRDEIEKPERVIFDIDPGEDLGFEHVRNAALDIRKALGDWGLESFPLATGGKGIHVIAPLRRVTEWPEVKAFCKTFAQRLADSEPDRFTAVLSKARRKGRLFIDYLRNERGSTAICPWSTRSREGAPCAVPVSWDEIETLASASAFDIGHAAARAGWKDPWPGYFKLDQSITKGMVNAVAGPLK